MNENNLHSLSGRFQIILDETEITQKILAEIAGISESYLTQILKEKRTPSDRVLRLIENKLGYKKDWIRAGEEPKMTEIRPEPENGEIKKLKEELARANAIIDALVKKYEKDPPEDGKKCYIENGTHGVILDKNNSSIDNRFSYFLNDLKKNKNIKQLEVARRIGVKPNYLSEIKSGRAKNPKDWVLEGIEREFGYRKEWLRTGEEPMMTEIKPELELGEIEKLNEELARANAIIDALIKKYEKDPPDDGEDSVDDVVSVRDYSKKK